MQKLEQQEQKKIKKEGLVKNQEVPGKVKRETKEEAREIIEEAREIIEEDSKIKYILINN